MTAGTTFLYATRNDIPQGVRLQVVELLNHRLADAIDLSTQAKQAHWNVKGPEFSPLHLLFDAVHGAAEEYADLLAERVVQVGGVAAGTTRMVAKATELAEYPAAVMGAEHVAAMATALAAFGARVRLAITQTAKWGDQGSSDICTEVSRGADKWLWMVEAHGQGRPPAA